MHVHSHTDDNLDEDKEGLDFLASDGDEVDGFAQNTRHNV